MPHGPDQDEPLHGPAGDEPPPFLGTWNRVYAVVLAYLAAVIALFAWFGRAFSG